MFKLSAPGKTFIIGEYYATQHGEAYLFATQPRFDLTANAGQPELHNIRIDSPAGKFIHANAGIFADLKMTFHDPYNGAGGLGASTAQFILIHELWQIITKKTVSIQNLEQSYLNVAWNGHGVKPSAADLLTQIYGGMCHIDKKNKSVNTLQWPFPELMFHIIHTNNKLATHTHLSDLDPDTFDSLREPFNLFKRAIAGKNPIEFCTGLNRYWEELQNLRLASDHSQQLILQFKANTDILAAKGCGAMGADTILLITKPDAEKILKKLCRKMKLPYMANNQNLSPGLINGNSHEMVS